MIAILYYYIPLKKESKPHRGVLYIISGNYSDSASGKSKGTLLVSAKAEIKII